MSGTKHDCYPLVNKQFAIENSPVEIVDLPIKNGDFPSFFVCFVCLPEAISLPGGPGIKQRSDCAGMGHGKKSPFGCIVNFYL